MPNTGKATSSTARISTKLASPFPRNSAAPGTGAAMSASRQSFGSSRAKLRFRISVPAKRKTIHSKPPEISRVVSSVGSKAKLKISRTTSANANEALMASLVRISAYTQRHRRGEIQGSPALGRRHPHRPPRSHRVAQRRLQNGDSAVVERRERLIHQQQ